MVPVADVDRAKNFCQALGWRLDADFVTAPDFRVIKMTPARLGLRRQQLVRPAGHHPPARPGDV